MARCGRGRVSAHPASSLFCSPQVKLTVPFGIIGVGWWWLRYRECQGERNRKERCWSSHALLPYLVHTPSKRWQFKCYPWGRNG